MLRQWIIYVKLSINLFKNKPVECVDLCPFEFYASFCDQFLAVSLHCSCVKQVDRVPCCVRLPFSWGYTSRSCTLLYVYLPLGVIQADLVPSCVNLVALDVRTTVIMVNKCSVPYCSTGKPGAISADEKPHRSVSTFHFAVHNAPLTEKWIYFVNKTEWKPSKNSVICEKHFERQYIKYEEKRNHLLYELNPIPAIHTEEASTIPASVLRVPTLPRTAPAERNVVPDEKVLFKKQDKIVSLACLHRDIEEKLCCIICNTIMSEVCRRYSRQ